MNRHGGLTTTDDRLSVGIGNGVRQILGKDAGPIRSLIVGIVDAVYWDA